VFGGGGAGSAGAFAAGEWTVGVGERGVECAIWGRYWAVIWYHGLRSIFSNLLGIAVLSLDFLHECSTSL